MKLDLLTRWENFSLSKKSIHCFDAIRCLDSLFSCTNDLKYLK